MKLRRIKYYINKKIQESFDEKLNEFIQECNFFLNAKETSYSSSFISIHVSKSGSGVGCSKIELVKSFIHLINRITKDFHDIDIDMHNKKGNKETLK